MNIPLTAVFALLILHWISDFVFQNSYMALGKSKNNLALLAHATVYSGVFLFLLPLYLVYVAGLGDEPFSKLLIFVGITFICHLVTDWITSRINSHHWNTKQIYRFWVGIGADQHILHLPQLFLTYWFLFIK